MAYSQFYLKNKLKIPTGIGIFVIVFFLLILNRAFFSVFIPLRANTTNIMRIELGNITSKQAAVYWRTQKEETGWIIYGENPKNLNHIVFDQRDIDRLANDKKMPYKNHYVALKELKENTDYYYKIVSNNTLVGNNGNPYTFRTLSEHSQGTAISPVYSKTINGNGTPLEGAVVLFTVGKTYPMVTYTLSKGEWLIPLTRFVLRGTNTVQSILPEDVVTIEIISEKGEESVIHGNIGGLSGLPQTIIIGRNYDFTNHENVLAASDVGSVNSDKTISIVFPRENAIIPGFSPLIKGTAVPNSEIILIIHAQTDYSSKVRVDEKGYWRLKSPVYLVPGVHTMQLIAKDKDGKEVRLDRSFTTTNVGEQVLGEATAEPSPPRTTPTVILSPTTVPQATVSATISVPPQPGNNSNVAALISASFIIVGIGILLAF